MKLPEWTLDRVGEANQPKTERALSEFLRFQCSKLNEVKSVKQSFAVIIAGSSQPTERG
jgi:hypothetical protein